MRIQVYPGIQNEALFQKQSKNKTTETNAKFANPDHAADLYKASEKQIADGIKRNNGDGCSSVLVELL